jgi:hypothetical protein
LQALAELGLILVLVLITILILKKSGSGDSQANVPLLAVLKALTHRAKSTCPITQRILIVINTKKMTKDILLINIMLKLFLT